MLHKKINTIHVYTKNNKVFLKKNTSTNNFKKEEWYPINFQWIPIIKLQNNLKNEEY